MQIGVPRETAPGERRVALVPDAIIPLTKLGFSIAVETGAGEPAGFQNAAYEQKGAALVSRSELFGRSDIITAVRPAFTAASELKRNQILIGAADPFGAPEAMKALAEAGVTLFALELLPRITRAQAMDILSSMATIAGYKAVLMAAAELPRMFPMLITAAGTVNPAKVFVIGAGVAGLQAIATARRLGAIVKGYDVRPAVKEQVESLGAKFVEMELESAEGEGGYAKSMDESFYRKQRELMARVVAESDVVITTAAIPGRKAPVLITADIVRSMAPGSVIVDLAAATGGNCELTRPEENVRDGAVLILGPTNLPSTVPYHASMMFSKNLQAFLKNLLNKEGNLRLDEPDEIIRDSMVIRSGEIVNPKVAEAIKG
ncbi:MAG: Re/Si-specific NAD(P)(+) transhydrogenase subunit alpha [Calditrichaeota bacterium]|nr:Re/Si-specific NAD(P)(+) transhydrogenase subunit alpha [Calditrichota bacterium]